MDKKQYLTPEMEEMEMNSQTVLITTSGDQAPTVNEDEPPF